MSAKGIVAFSALALLVQSTWSQCIPHGFGCNNFVPAASTGGSFVVTSSSPLPPTGVSIIADNLYEGVLFAAGTLPLLGSVAVEGTMGTAGAGAVSYGCGDSVDIIAEEGPIVTGIVNEGFFGNGVYGFGNLYGNRLYGFFGNANGLYYIGAYKKEQCY